MARPVATAPPPPRWGSAYLAAFGLAASPATGEPKRRPATMSAPIPLARAHMVIDATTAVECSASVAAATAMVVEDFAATGLDVMVEMPRVPVVAKRPRKTTTPRVQTIRQLIARVRMYMGLAQQYGKSQDQPHRSVLEKMSCTPTPSESAMRKWIEQYRALRQAGVNLDDEHILSRPYSTDMVMELCKRASPPPAPPHAPRVRRRRPSRMMVPVFVPWSYVTVHI